jgi:hypothetical protein
MNSKGDAEDTVRILHNMKIIISEKKNEYILERKNIYVTFKS